MKSKAFLLIAGLCSSACLVPLAGQGSGGSSGAGGAGAGGDGVAGSGAAAAGPSAGTGSAATGATSGATSAPVGTSSATTSGASSAAPSTTTNADTSAIGTGTGPAPGTPDMSPTMPSHSVLNTPTPPDVGDTRAATRQGLPAGLSVAPTPPGISPLSGLPLADLPSVSRGTSPLGPQSGAAVAAQTADPTAGPGSTPQVPVAAHPLTNPRIGMGSTIVVPSPPPPAQAEPKPAESTNDLGEVWVDGHYSWDNGQWRWVNGTWERPPNKDAAWIPGHYEPLTKRWTEGHWSVTNRPETREGSGSGR